MKILTVLCALGVCFGVASAGVFDDWPQGKDPEFVGQKVSSLLLQGPLELYHPQGFSGEGYTHGKFVPYAICSLWVNAVEFARETGDAELRDRLVRQFDPFLGEKRHLRSKDDHVDYAIFGAVALEHALVTGNERSLEIGLHYAAEQWREPVDFKLPDPYYLLPYVERKALWEQGYSPQTRFWIDDMYMLPFLQVQAYRLSRDKEHLVKTAREMCLYLDRLQRKDGLFDHGTGAPHAWGRGNGWIAAGMALLLRQMEVDDVGPADLRLRIADGYRRMMATLLKYQRADGMWGQLIDGPDSWAESSGTAMFAYSFVEGVVAGVLDAQVYGTAARKAYLALVERLDEHGNLKGTCIGTCKSANRQDYLDRPVRTGDPHGQAPLMWLVTALLAANPIVGDLHLIGDSTLAVCPEPTYRGSYGKALEPMFKRGHKIVPHAIGGYAAPQFYRNAWAKALASMKPGDFALVAFGHNDQDPKQKSAPNEGYRDALRKFAAEAKAKGVHLTFATPIVRCVFNSDTELWNAGLREYAEAMIRTAKELDVPCVDMNRLTGEEVLRCGARGSEKYYMLSAPDGKHKDDRTHPTKIGAACFAEIFRTAAEGQRLPIARLFRLKGPEERWDRPPEGFRVSKWLKENPPFAMDKRLELIAPAADGELRLTPTFVNCSVVWGSRRLADGVSLEYRKPGGTWQVGLKPVYFADVSNYRGSILGLEEDTEYEVRLCHENRPVARGKVRTWRSQVPVVRTVVIDPATAKYPVVISDKGSPDGWIRYTTAPGAVLGGADKTDSLIVVRNAAYILLDDMTIEGGGGEGHNAVLIEKSKGVRVRNCELYGFGRTGSQVFTVRGKGRYYDTQKNDDPNPGRRFDWDAGVMINPGSGEVTVERCYIHDARNQSNAWYYSHPAGSQGIFIFRPTGSVVLRWNDIVGSDNHRWNDAVEGCDNFEEDGGFNRDSDIYGNFLIYANDDCIELDGGQQNVRCFRNRFEAAYSDLSLQGCMVSPVYVYENLFAPCCDQFGRANPCVKTYGFNMYWYRPYAYLRGNVYGEADDEPCLGQLARWDWREGNVFVTNDVPVEASCRLPERPIPFILDRGVIRGVTVEGTSSSPSAIRITGRASAVQTYQIRKNHDADWFDVSPVSGELKPGENVLTVTFRPERMIGRRHWRSAFLVRTPEGLSRCVSVYAERTDFEQTARPVSASARTAYCDTPKPVVFPAATKDAAVAEFPFEIGTAGNYWFAVRGKKGSWAKCRVEMAVDDGPFNPVHLLFAREYASWNVLRAGATDYQKSGEGLDPYVLAPGRHVLRIRAHGQYPAILLNAAVTDDPAGFEPR